MTMMMLLLIFVDLVLCVVCVVCVCIVVVVASTRSRTSYAPLKWERNGVLSIQSHAKTRSYASQNKTSSARANITQLPNNAHAQNFPSLFFLPPPFFFSFLFF